MIAIRRADEEDWEDILEADAVCLPDDARPALEGAAWWVAENEHGDLAGYAGAKLCKDSPGCVYLCRAGVLPAFRGHQLQRRLVRARERWARAAGNAYIVTDTYRNPASANTLIACGFKMYQPAVPWSYPDACYWWRSLQHA